MALKNKKFGPELQEKAVQLAREGNYRTTIGKALGVHPDSFFRWLGIGRDDLEAERDTELARFVEAFEEAEAQWEVEKVSQINSAAASDSKHWTAAMTMMERKFPDRWGRREHVTVEGERPVQQLNQVVLIDADAREVARDLLRRVGGASPHESIGPGVGSESEGDVPGVVEHVAPRPAR